MKHKKYLKAFLTRLKEMAKPSSKFIDPYCDACVKEGFVKSAAGFCPKCADFVCKPCLEKHSEQSETEHHKILTGSAMPAKQSEKPLKYQPCVHHPQELKDTYCLDHGLITCGKCASKDHKECDVKSILLAYKSFNISAEDQAFKATASHYLGHAQQIQMSVEENLTELEKQKNQLIKESQDFREQMTKQIRKTCDDFERKVLKNYMGQKGVLMGKLSTISEVVSNIEGALEDLQRQGIKTLGEARYFLHLKSNTETVLESSEKLKNLHDDLTYIDMTSQFSICINPTLAPQNKFIDVSLQLSNYEYEKQVPDIYIPCINRPPDYDIQRSISLENDTAWGETPRRQSSGDQGVTVTTVNTGERRRSSNQALAASSTDEQKTSGDPGLITPSPNNITKSEMPDLSRKEPKDQDQLSGNQTSGDAHITSTSTDDQKLKGGSFSKGDVTFRRLSLALEQSAKSLPSNVIILDAIEAEVHGDESACLILGLDITADGNVLLLDRNNRKLKMFTPEGEYMASRKLPKNPESVAVLADNKAAVSTWNKLIGIVDTTPNAGLPLRKSINLDYHAWGVAGYRDHLIISCSLPGSHTQSPSSVRMIDMHGKVKWSVTTDAEGMDLFKWAGFLTVKGGASRDTVIVTDQFRQTITVLNAHNGSIVKVCDVSGRTPRGVTCDENGEVYVCFESGPLTLWSADMSREKSPGNVDLKSPYAMAYDKKKKELFVTSSSDDSQYSDRIHRYHFRK